MCLDVFALAGEGEVASLLLALVQLPRTRGKVGGGKAHPIVSIYVYNMMKKWLKKVDGNIHLPGCSPEQSSANLNSQNIDGQLVLLGCLSPYSAPRTESQFSSF